MKTISALGPLNKETSGELQWRGEAGEKPARNFWSGPFFVCSWLSGRTLRMPGCVLQTSRWALLELSCLICAGGMKCHSSPHWGWDSGGSQRPDTACLEQCGNYTLDPGYVQKVSALKRVVRWRFVSRHCRLVLRGDKAPMLHFWSFYLKANCIYCLSLFLSALSDSLQSRVLSSGSPAPGPLVRLGLLCLFISALLHAGILAGFLPH